MTNGIVSVTRNGKVIIKVVAGCDGYNADKLVQVIKDHGLTTAAEIHDQAYYVKFGCMGCLVVQDVGKDIFRGEDELGPLYREKFDDPQFNPRWDVGMAPYVRVVELENS